MHPALLYFPHRRLSPAELSAARLDGHLVEVGEGFMPADTVEGACARAASLAPLGPAGAAVMGPSAAWVHGAGDRPPAHHHILRAGPRRLREPAEPRVLLHEITAAPDAVEPLGEVPVTTALRTMCDLVWMSRRHPEFIDWARMLGELRPGLAEQALATVEAWPRRPGRTQALTALRALLGPSDPAQELVTR